MSTPYFASSLFGIARKTFSLSLLILATLCIGCGGSDNDGSTFSSSTNLRIFHASPDAPSVDLFVDGSRRVFDTSFRNQSNFVTVQPGENTIQLNVAGSTTVALEVVVDFAENTATTLAAVNLLPNISAILINDDLIAPGEGLIKFRIGHLAPSAPNLDIFISSPDEDLDFLSPVFTNVSFTTVSEFLQVPRGQYRIRATVAGTQVVAADSGEINLDGERIFTILGLDSEGGGEPFSFEIIRDQPQ